jgi:hypothetical protein
LLCVLCAGGFAFAFALSAALRSVSPPARILALAGGDLAHDGAVKIEAHFAGSDALDVERSGRRRLSQRDSFAGSAPG